jgi:hypothetical protein
MYVPEEVQEFDAPKAPQPVADATTGEVIEGEVVPPPEPKKQLVKVTREAFVAMRDEIDKCGTVDELKALWRSKAFQAEFVRLPQDYKDGIIEHFDLQTKAATESPLEIPAGYNFDNLQQEGADAV